MRLTHVCVTKLFDIFDHSIPLRLEDRITIIHGPNGYGKTAILTMLQGLLANQFSIFRRIPYETFSVRFDSGADLELTKKVKTNGDEDSHPALNFHYTKDGKSQEFTLDFPASRQRLGIPLEYVDRHLEGLERLGPETWLHIPSGRRLDIDDVVDLYGDFLPGPSRKKRKLPSGFLRFPSSLTFA